MRMDTGYEVTLCVVQRLFWSQSREIGSRLANEFSSLAISIDPI